MYYCANDEIFMRLEDATSAGLRDYSVAQDQNSQDSLHILGRRSS
jgi:hypothetical protein